MNKTLREKMMSGKAYEFSELPKEIADIIGSGKAIIVPVEDEIEEYNPRLYDKDLMKEIEELLGTDHNMYKTLEMAIDHIGILEKRVKNGKPISVDNLIAYDELVKYVMEHIGYYRKYDMEKFEADSLGCETYDEFMEKYPDKNYPNFRDYLVKECSDELKKKLDVAGICTICPNSRELVLSIYHKNIEYDIIDDMNVKSAGFMHNIRWNGVRYEIYTPSDVEESVGTYFDTCIEEFGFVWFKPMDDLWVYCGEDNDVFGSRNSYTDFVGQTFSLGTSREYQEKYGKMMQDMYESNLLNYVKNYDDFAVTISKMENGVLTTVNMREEWIK